jgi:hypothetical protein
MTWDDARIDAAYRDLAARGSAAGIADAVADVIRRPVGHAEPTSGRSWRAWFAIAAVFVLVAVGVGVATIPHSSGGPRNGGLNHFHTQGLDFDYPASWSIHDQLPPSSGFGQTWAVIGTHAWPSSCGASDINCYYEAKLEPGTIAVDIGVSYFPATDDDLCTRGATGSDLAGRGPDDPVATRTLIRVDGRPALKTTYDVPGTDYYQSDEWLDWTIAALGTVDEAYFIDAKVRGPGTDAMKAELDALIASIRLSPGPNDSQDLADCGAPFPSPDASRAASEPDTLELAAEPASAPLPSGAVRACDQGLLGAVRIVRVGNSVRVVSVEDGTEVAVTWPTGFSAHLVGGVAEIVASDGTVVGSEGAVLVRLGGGSSGAADGRVSVEPPGRVFVGPSFLVCSVNGRVYLP